jgi:hypothetical protein
MRVIPTRIHGVIDYLTGVLLIASPWLFGFADGGAAQWVPIILGALVILQSLVTDYELGATRLLPMPMHLVLDAVSGAVLAVSPWLLGFADQVWGPHVAIGLFEIVVSLLSEKEPESGAAAGRQTV